MEESQRTQRNADRLSELAGPFAAQIASIIAGLERDGYRPRIQEAYRSPEDQMRQRLTGRSKLSYGFHNVRSADGHPQAWAVDLLDDDNPLHTPLPYALRLAYEARRRGLRTGVLWGLSARQRALVNDAIDAQDWRREVRIGWDECHIEPTGITPEQVRDGGLPTFSGAAPDPVMARCEPPFTVAFTNGVTLTAPLVADRAWVPMRAFAEAIGTTVTWQGDGLPIKLGAQEYRGQVRSIDGSTYALVREIAECCGLELRVEEQARHIVVMRPATMTPLLGQIVALADRSGVLSHYWDDRGRAPVGLARGMAATYARAYAKLKAKDEAAIAMAAACTDDPSTDALAWYADAFAAAGLDNSQSGADTLRHLFVLLTGLAMRESSGRYCEGRDRSASNNDPDTAEAGLFQTSFNARTAHPLMAGLFDSYSQSSSGFLPLFAAGVTMTARDMTVCGTGPGARFQTLSKLCPAFAAEFAALGLRHLRQHWGPINRHEAGLLRACDDLLLAVQKAVDGAGEGVAV
ncbi:MAG: hypothetical protein HZB16_04030 [Armatimonadetes bacterium]|nr:hypothetical protein [Armatimonadota bacterium]